MKALEEVRQYEESFNEEYRVVSDIKCALLLNESIEDYSFEESEIVKTEDGYILSYGGRIYRFKVVDRRIVSYETEES